MSSGGFYAVIFRISTKIAKIQKLSASDFPAIAYSRCCAFGVFSFRLSVSGGKAILFAKFWWCVGLCDLAMCMDLVLAYYSQVLKVFTAVTVFDIVRFIMVHKISYVFHTFFIFKGQHPLCQFF